MKREDLKTRMTAAGVPSDKIGELVDYIMEQNGVDINTLKSELESTKGANAEKIKTLESENAELKTKVDGFKDYEDLKKFKADTLEKAESDKKIEFLKAQGCKHPDLIIGKLDFTKGTYDEEKKTYTGLDDDVKGLREAYGDLFEQAGTQKITPAAQGQSSNTFLDQYLKDNPNMSKYTDQH